MRGRGFREISKLTYHSERAKHVRIRNQNHSNPVQISFLYWRRPAAGQGPVGPSSMLVDPVGVELPFTARPVFHENSARPGGDTIIKLYC